MSHKATDPALNPSLSPEPTLTPPPHPLLIPGSDGGVEEGDSEESDRGVRVRGEEVMEVNSPSPFTGRIKGPDSLLVL